MYSTNYIIWFSVDGNGKTITRQTSNQRRVFNPRQMSVFSRASSKSILFGRGSRKSSISHRSSKKSSFSNRTSASRESYHKTNPNSTPSGLRRMEPVGDDGYAVEDNVDSRRMEAILEEDRVSEES